MALYWYEVRLPIGRMIASMQAMREGQAVTLDDARRDDEFGQLARAIVEFSMADLCCPSFSLLPWLTS